MRTFDDTCFNQRLSDGSFIIFKYQTKADVPLYVSETSCRTSYGVFVSDKLVIRDFQVSVQFRAVVDLFLWFKYDRILDRFVRRQCFFPTERKLKFFKVYTQRNCELECLSNYTYTQCGCVAFSMPRDPLVKICSSGKIPCVDKAQDDLLTQEILRGLAENNEDENVNDEEKALQEKLKNVAKQCNCMPACTSINYDVEVSQADFNWQKLFIAFKTNFSALPDVNMARMVLFFKESQFITSKRSELYGQTDFLANCGGLLGLFLGFSILSLFEIVYFLTLRAFCNLKNRIKPKRVDCENNMKTFDDTHLKKSTENCQE